MDLRTNTAGSSTNTAGSGTGATPMLAFAGLHALVCLLRAQPLHTHPKRIPQRGRAARGRAPPFMDAAEGRLLYGWVCRGWAGSKHTKTWSLAKENFWAGPVPRPAVVLDPEVLVLRSMDIHRLSLDVYG